MHGHMNVKSPNNTGKWQMGFNSAFKGLTDIATVNTSHAPTSFSQPEASFGTRIIIKVKVKVRTWCGVEIYSTRL
jgi:hypothetical protein